MTRDIVITLGLVIAALCTIAPSTIKSANDGIALGLAPERTGSSTTSRMVLPALRSRSGEVNTARHVRRAHVKLPEPAHYPAAVEPSPPNNEKGRIIECAGQMDEQSQQTVRAILQRRIDRSKRGKAGLDRFMVVGASASRAREFLTGFGNPKRYHLSADWQFLQPTIDWVSGERTYQNSFIRKKAAVSGTTAGNWVWRQAFCDDCPDRLATEIRTFSPAFALVMFGTNNVSWGPRPGYERYFKQWIAAGYNDARCAKEGRCLPPYELGDITYPDHASERALPRYIASIMSAKRKAFRTGYVALLESLLARDIVPIISTIPPMPRRWLDEDTVVVINREIRQIGHEYSLPVIDLWCALNPMDSEGLEDWIHPVMTNNKGIGVDRYHPQSKNAFHVDDTNLVHGYLVRNVLTLLRLSEMRDVAFELLREHELGTAPEVAAN